MNANIKHPHAARFWRCWVIIACLACGQFSVPAQNVRLSWPANPETNVVSYIVYLATNTPSYTAAILLAATNYTLSNVTAGLNYYFAVTAVNDEGLESVLSDTNRYFRVNSRPNVAGPVTVTAAKATPAPVTGLGVSDADAVTNLTLTLSATRGTISVLTTAPGGVTASQVSANGSGSVSIRASLMAINATLGRTNGLVYTGRLNLVGSDTLIMGVNDNDPVGLGGPLSSTRLITLNVVGDTLDAWRNQYFSSTDLTDPGREGSVWGDLADPDQDGRQNLMEFALALNPMNREASSAGMVSDLIATNGSNYMTLTFRQQRNAAFLQYVPQVSGDKQTWVTGPGAVQLVSATVLDSQTQLVSYQDLTPVDAQRPRFMRLKVSR